MSLSTVSPVGSSSPSAPASASAAAPDGPPTHPMILTPEPARLAMAQVLADVLGRAEIPADADFFTDLGADSLTMARFCGRVRKRGDLPTISMSDVYAHPTVRGLCDALAGPVPAAAHANATGFGDAAEHPGPSAVVTDAIAQAQPETGSPHRATTLAFVACGCAQAMIFLVYIVGMSAVGAAAYLWMDQAAGLFAIYVRSMAAAAAVFAVATALPIAAKWLLIGRWTPREIPVWSLGYLRFWLVRTLVRTSPLALFVGSPIVCWYLRALGARIGRDVTILTRSLPVATDLLTIGDGTLVRKDSVLNGYRAHAGRIEIDSVSLGRDVLVSEACVLDIGTAMGDGAQLGHRSSVQRGQVVPAGESWHGSPARPASVDYASVGPRPCGRARRLGYACGQLLFALLVTGPLGIGLILFALSLPRAQALLGAAPHSFTDPMLYLDGLAFATVLFVARIGIGLVSVTVVAALLARLVTVDRVYPLFGLADWAHRRVARLSNNRFFTGLLGDSSYITGYLGLIGYHLGRVQQTGSNFGTEVRHESPYHVSVGRGTMVADGLSIANADYSSSSFRITHARLGASSFLGNHIVLPGRSRVGDDCLLATKVMVPIDGPLRSGVGLLGSPPMQIPRTVERDAAVDAQLTRRELRRLLAAKNRHNLGGMVVLLFARWLILCAAVLVGLAALELSDSLGVLAIAAGVVVNTIVTLLLGVAVERVAAARARLEPRFCSIYDPRFWRHERYWKLHVPAMAVGALNGTPFKPLVWRMLGTQVGARLFDDGVSMPERPMVSLGDDCTLNAGSIIQCHSQEDGAFKADRTRLGSGVTLGVGALVHYGVTVEDAVTVAADSFVMKGEELPENSLWGGNPARFIPTRAGAPTPARTHLAAPWP